MNVRKVVKTSLVNNDFDLLEEAYEKDGSGVLRTLQLHVFALPNDLLRWRAIEMLGSLAEKHAVEEDEVYRNIVRRFIWQMCEEGANVPWASPEVIGSIISKAPKNQFIEFIGPMFYHAGLNEICFAGLFWAVIQLEADYRKVMEEFLPKTLERLEIDELELRGYGAVALGLMQHKPALPYLEKLLQDDRSVLLFLEGDLKSVVISDLAEKAIQQIQGA